MDNDNNNNNINSTENKPKEGTQPTQKPSAEDDKVKNISDIKAENKKKTTDKQSSRGKKKNTSNKKKGKNSSSDNNQKAPKKSYRRLITALICAVLVLAAAITFAAFNNDNIFELGQSNAAFSQEYSAGIKADFRVAGNNIFYVSKDGMTLLNSKGETEYTDTYSMSSPVMLVDNKCAAVADLKGKLLNVYNTKGKLYSKNLEGAITTFAVNPIGYSAVMCQNTAENDYMIYVYDQTGEVASVSSFSADDGIPIAIDISDDGQRYSISTLETSDIKLKSNILFYYTDKNTARTESNNSDGLFSALSREDSIVSVLHFMPDGSCVAVSDKAMENIGGGDTSSYIQNWTQSFTNRITAVDFVDDRYIAVAYGTSFDHSADSGLENTLEWYNYQNGKKTGSYKLDDTATMLYSANNATIAVMDKTFVAVDIRGKFLWKYTALQSVNSIQFYKKLNRIIVATSSKMSMFNIKNGAVIVESNDNEDDDNEATADPEATAATTVANEATADTEATTATNTATTAENTTEG
jgi:hypothetical protein